MKTDLKTEVWKAYITYLRRDLAVSKHPNNGWFEATKANDEIMRNNNPDLAKAFRLAKQAAHKSSIWKPLFWVLFQQVKKRGDQVKFRRPHAAAATNGGIIENLTTHSRYLGEGFVSVRLKNGVCVNSSIMNLEDEFG